MEMPQDLIGLVHKIEAYDAEHWIEFVAHLRHVHVNWNVNMSERKGVTLTHLHDIPHRSSWVSTEFHWCWASVPGTWLKLKPSSTQRFWTKLRHSESLPRGQEDLTEQRESHDQ